MATVVNGSVNPPDNSGKWHDDGWGGWIDDSSLSNQVPNGYFNCWGRIIIPEKPNATLDSKTKENVLKTLDEAKSFEDTKVGRLMSQILTYGHSFVDLLVRTKIIDNVTLPISYGNINQDELDKRLNSGDLRNSTQVDGKQSSSRQPTNSTFLGIDFSNTSNILLLIAGAVGVTALLASKNR